MTALLTADMARPLRRESAAEWRQDPPEAPGQATCGECDAYIENPWGGDVGICSRLSTWPDGLLWVSEWERPLRECGLGESADS